MCHFSSYSEINEFHRFSHTGYARYGEGDEERSPLNDGRVTASFLVLEDSEELDAAEGVEPTIEFLS